MKVREVAPQDTLYQFKYDYNTDSYVLGESVKISKVNSKYIYLDDNYGTKLLRKGKFPLVDNIGRDAWIAVVMDIKWDMYSPDKNWNIGYNKRVKEENEADSEISPQLNRIKNLFYSLSLEDKKVILKKLKDIN